MKYIDDQCWTHATSQKAIAAEPVGNNHFNNIGQQGDHVHENSDGGSGEETEAGAGEPEDAQKHSSKLPSASELRAINEARNLYKNNRFKAQVRFLFHGLVFLYILCSCFYS